MSAQSSVAREPGRLKVTRSMTLIRSAGWRGFPTPMRTTTWRSRFSPRARHACWGASPGRQSPVLSSRQDPFLIDWSGGSGKIPRFSFAELLDSGFSRDLKGKTVLIGTALEVGSDKQSTAVDVEMAGVEVQANAIATALAGFPLREAPGLIGVLMIGFCAFLPPLAGLSGRRLALPLATTITAVGLALGGQLLFGAGLLVPLVYPALALGLGLAATLLYLQASAERRAARARSALRRFVPASMVEAALAGVGQDLRLAAERRVCSVLFCDLVGFVRFAEARGPEVVVEVLNRYFVEVSQAIEEQGGTIIAFLGDGVMAVFGAPLDQPDHADRALAAARSISTDSIDALNRWLSSRGIAQRFEIGVGVNSGEVMAGNVGSDERLEYAAVGDATNTAARLQAATRERPEAVLISNATRELLTRPAGLNEVGSVSLRGRSDPIRAFTI